MMRVTRVKVTPAPPNEHGRLLGFASMCLDDALVVRDIRIIAGPDGPFVAFPSRKINRPCAKCGERVPCDTKFCGYCGWDLTPFVPPNGRIYADCAHPADEAARAYLAGAVLAAWRDFAAANPAVRP